MQSAPLPDNEEERLNRLALYQILDTPPEDAFDRITRIVAETIGVPIALVSLVDRDRQWFKSRRGLDAMETPREVAFCAHAILGDDLFVVEDATKDARFCDNPLVENDPSIRFYAGAPLTSAQGFNLGTLCAIDTKPRQLTENERHLLSDLATLVVDELELRVALRGALQDAADAAKKETVQNEFITHITHELRTPLTSIRGSLGLLESGALRDQPEKAEQILTIANRNTESLLTLINDLLDFQKFELGKMTFDFGVVDADALVRDTCKLMEGTAEARDVTLVVEPNANKAIIGDQARLAQLLSNLISNAIKFSPKGEKVRILSALRGRFLRLSVIDAGAGIPKAFQGQIFERFAQAPGPNKPKGTGLGLAICKLITEAHRGEISFESGEGCGTSFHADLPLSQSVLPNS